MIIAGGGLAGGLAAMGLARRRPDVEILLVEQGERFGGIHTWSYFDSDIAPEARWALADIGAHHWPDHEIRFPRRRRVISIGYNSFRAADFDRAIREVLTPSQYRLGVQIDAVAPTHVVLRGGERIEGDAVIDARGPDKTPGLELGWQKFLGQVRHFPNGHGVGRPVIMDATVPQHDGFRFIYLLPYSPTELLIEDTYYSRSSALDRETLRSRVVTQAASIGDSEVVDEEEGVLPLVIGGSLGAVWPSSDAWPRLGARGGFFHPTTSYSLPDAVANAAFLAEQPDLTSRALAQVLRARSQRLWSERSFFRFLNGLLFKAADPDESYRVLEHFYRLPPALIGRFYAATLTPFDRLRILTGKPPVPIGRALSVIRQSAA